MSNSAAIRERQRLLWLALTLLIHAGLFQLLLTPRPAQLESFERSTDLVLLPDREKSARVPRQVAPLAPSRLPEAPPPASTAPQLIVPREPDDTRTRPAVDWAREAEEVARERALAGEAGRESGDRDATPKPKPEFGWSHSRIHRVEPMEGGGFMVWISDNCFIAIGLMAMPMCKLGKKPPRGDLFEHMNDAPTPGDWKDD